MRSSVTPFRRKFAALMTGRVLDCGAGEGVYHDLLVNADSIVSADIDEENLRRISGEYVVASAADLPFADNSFDSVWACAVIEHVAEDILPELLRVCKVGGRIAALTPNARSPFDLVLRAMGKKGLRDYAAHVNVRTVRDLRRYGPVYGEVRFLPFLSGLFYRLPSLAHTVMLYAEVTPELKKLARRKEA